MNDLRRFLIWISVLFLLAIGIWGLQQHERSGERPFAPENRRFRLSHQVRVLGHDFYVPLRRMAYGWAAVACAAAALWPMATDERSRRWLGRMSRDPTPPPPKLRS